MNKVVLQPIVIHQPEEFRSIDLKLMSMEGETYPCISVLDSGGTATFHFESFDEAVMVIGNLNKQIQLMTDSSHE